MTKEEFDAHMLLAAFRRNNSDTYERYGKVRAYGMTVRISRSIERVYIKYDLDPPNLAVWEHNVYKDSFAEAWDFIRNFLQEHPT